MEAFRQPVFGSACGGLRASVLAKHEFMAGLYPDSVVQADDTLFIGMRGGILTFDLNNNESKWYEKK